MAFPKKDDFTGAYSGEVVAFNFDGSEAVPTTAIAIEVEE